MTRMLCVLVAVVVLTLTSGAASAQQATRIAVANPAKIFGEMQELQELRAKMDSERKLLEGVDREKKEKLMALESARDALKADTPQWQERNAELLKAAIEYEAWSKITQQNFQREQKMQLKTLYEKIEKAVGEVAKQKGFDVVIADQRSELPDNLDRMNIDQLRAVINSRTVLFSAPTADISADVLAALDSQYRAAPKK